MMNLFPLAFLLLASPAVLAQNLTLLEGLLQTFTGSGLNRLATVVTGLNSSDAGQSILTQLSNGSPFLLFAPSDEACESDIPMRILSIALTYVCS